MTPDDFENFIEENNCSDILNVNKSKLLRTPVELWFWYSLKQNSSRACIIENKWKNFIKIKRKKNK